MNINDLEKLKAEMERNHNSSIESTERVLKKIREAANTPASIVQTPRFKERMPVIVEKIIINYVGNFQISDVARKYRELTGRTTSDNVRNEISNCINKLKHRNPPEIDVVQAGKGSRSGIYTMRTN